MSYKINHANIKEWAKNYDGPLFDGILCDPPYELGFMGKSWDSSGIAFDKDMWTDLLKILKPGGHLLAFSGSRTYHRMACAIEDAGFEIRDMIEWVYGSGFPKSLNIGKAVDKIAPRIGQFDRFAEHFKQQRLASGKPQKEIATLFPSKTGGITGCVWNWENGANVPTSKQWAILQPLLKLSDEFGSLIDRIERERELIGKHETDMGGLGGERLGQKGGNITKGTSPYEGYGTALKPAHEPCVLARKPIEGTVAKNVLKHGTGGLNIDGSRVGADSGYSESKGNSSTMDSSKDIFVVPNKLVRAEPNNLGRFPANLIHDGSDEVVGLFPDTVPTSYATSKTVKGGMFGMPGHGTERIKDTTRSAARFFMTCKDTQKHAIMNIWNDINVNNVASNSTITLLIEKIVNITSALRHVPLNTDLVNHSLNVFFVGEKSKSTEIDFVAKLVAIKEVPGDTLSQQELKAIQDFMQNSGNSTQTQSHVSDAENKDNTDITQITVNLLKLCGYVLHVIDENTKQANQENDSDQATETRFLYTAKASKSERNAGLEGFEDIKLDIGDDRPSGSFNERFGHNEPKPTKNAHPTVKPLSLTKYLANLIKPPTGGRLLVPFSGSGSEMIGALQAGWEYVEGVELTEEYIPIAEARIKHWLDKMSKEQLEML